MPPPLQVAALSSPALLTQFIAAVVMEYTAEEGGEAGRAQLVALKAIPALLRLLQVSDLRGCWRGGVGGGGGGCQGVHWAGWRDGLWGVAVCVTMPPSSAAQQL